MGPIIDAAPTWDSSTKKERMNDILSAQRAIRKWLGSETEEILTITKD
jgi:hypothetical protein